MISGHMVWKFESKRVADVGHRVNPCAFWSADLDSPGGSEVGSASVDKGANFSCDARGGPSQPLVVAHGAGVALRVAGVLGLKAPRADIANRRARASHEAVLLQKGRADQHGEHRGETHRQRMSIEALKSCSPSCCVGRLTGQGWQLSFSLSVHPALYVPL